MKHYSEKYHRRSIRLREYDYSQVGAYFVTLCTHNRECVFGAVADGEIVLSARGEIAKQFWEKIPKHFPNASLDKYGIMPNHVHGIIILTDDCRGGVTPPYHEGEATSPLRKHTLGQIVAHFKYQATRAINQMCRTPGKPVWQRNYYEHVIRNEEDLGEIREYVVNNRLKWELDKENPKNFKLL